MRRAIPALGLTLMGTALVLRFQTASPTDVAASAPVGQAADTAAADTAATDITAPDGEPATTAADGEPATTVAADGASGDVAVDAADGLVDGTYVGASVGTRFGDVQVQIEVEDGLITAVHGLDYPWDDRHSQEINSWAIPQYTSAVVTAQSSAIDAMSGATITWEAFVASVQSAIEEATA